MKLLIGTTNRAKFSRYAGIVRDVAGDQHIHVLSPGEVGVSLSIDEDGETVADNARTKARAYAEVSGLATLSVDEGLEIAGLAREEQPGTRVRRYGGRERSDAELVRVMLEKIERVLPAQRAVTWTVALCLALPSGAEYIEQVTVLGGIATGAPPSIPPGYPLGAITTDVRTGKRVSELTPQEQRLRLAPVYQAVAALLRVLAFSHG